MARRSASLATHGDGMPNGSSGDGSAAQTCQSCGWTQRANCGRVPPRLPALRLSASSFTDPPQADRWTDQRQESCWLDRRKKRSTAWPSLCHSKTWDGTLATCFRTGRARCWICSSPNRTELRGTGGELLGRARYIVLWWNREGGASDLVLCGANEEHLGGAFAAHDLRSLEALMERVPSSSPRSMVTAAPPPAPRGVKRPEDYQYPYLWNLNPNMSAYAPDELVTLTFTITNVSDWPTALNYVPPRVTISSVQEGRDVAVLRHGVGHRTLEPGETATFTLMWDQTHFEGGRASAGRYIARIQLADLTVNWLLDSGPQADLILGELPEQMR